MEDLRVALVTKLKDFLSGGLKRIEGRLDTTKQRAQELDSKLKALRGFKELSKRMEELERKEQSLSKEHVNLKTKKSKLEAELKRLSRAYSEGRLSVREFESAQSKLQRELTDTVQKLTRLEAELSQVKREKREVEGKTLQLRRELDKLGVDVKEVDNLIAQYEKELRELGETAEKTSGRLSLLTRGLKGLGAVGGTSLLAGAVKGMFEIDSWARKIMFNTTLRGQQVQKQLVKDISLLRAQTLAGYEEISGVLTRLVQQTGRYDAQTVKTAKSILMLKRAMAGWDEAETTRAVTQMQKAWKLTGEEAAQLIYTIYQKAGDQANDLLDTFWEYAPALADAGIKAKEFAAILIAGAKEGAFNYDKIADAMKEAFKARMVEASNLQQILGDVEKQQEGLIDQLWGKGSEEWTKMKSALIDYVQAVQKGDKELSKRSFVQLVGVLTAAYKKDAIKTKELVESVFGAMGAEDVSIKVIEAISKAMANQEQYLKGAKDLQKAFEDSLNSLERLQRAWLTVWQNMVIGMKPVFDVLTKGLELIAEFAQEHRTLSTALVAGAATVGALGVAVKGLSLAFGVAKSGLSAFLAPFRLFKRESSALCSGVQNMGACMTAKGRVFSSLGQKVKSLGGILGGLRGRAFSLAGGFRLLTGAGKLLLGGLRLLGLTNPIGLAITGVTILGPKIWRLIGGVEGLKKAFSKVGSAVKKAFEWSPVGLFLKGLNAIKEKAGGLAKSLLEGVKGLWGRVKKIEPSAVLKGIKAVPVLGAAASAYEVERSLVERLAGGREVEKIPAVSMQTVPGLSKNVSFSPNITITVPAVNVSGGNVEEVKGAVLNALREGGEEVYEFLKKALKKFMEREEREF